jgi:pyridoxine kinase
MPIALILSSFVAVGRIGGAAQQYALAAHGIDPLLVPTVLLGRSPAKGAKGEPTAAALFSRMLEDVEADGLFGQLDLVITGHFSSEAQVAVAADALGRIRAAAGRRTTMVVDPILGDAPKGLYVKPEVAEAVAARLVPQADWITPNLWELGHLAGQELDGPAAVVAAARRLGKPALVTSAPAGQGEIGLILVGPETATLFAHPMLPQAPNGTGDLITASFGAGLVEGLSPLAAAERASRAAYEAVQAAQDGRASDLPIVALGPRLVRPTAPVRIERL